MNVSTGVAEHGCVHGHWANTCDGVEGAHHTVTAVRAIINTLVVPEPFNAAGLAKCNLRSFLEHITFVTIHRRWVL